MPLQTLYKNESLEWLDLKDPSPEELLHLHAHYGISQLFLEDVRDPNHLPKFEEDETLRFFLLRESCNAERAFLNSISDVSTKLGLFLFERTLITVHRLESDSISNTLKKMEKKGKSFSSSDIALELALQVIESFDAKSLRIVGLVDQIEDEIFLSKSTRKQNLRRLYKFKRQATLNSRVLSSSAQWVEHFGELELSPSEVNNLKERHQDVMADFEHLESQITNLISMFLALSDQAANQVMKHLAIYSMYFLPITFIAGVYGMNFKNIPELQNPFGYFAVLLFMLIITVFTFLYVKKKKW